MRRLERGQREQQPRLLAAGQLAGHRIGLVVAEARGGGAGALLRFGLVRHQVGDVIVSGTLRVQLVELVLGEIAEGQLLRCPAFARERVEPSAEQLGQRGFAVAVRAEQADAVVGVQPQIEIAQHRLVRSHSLPPPPRAGSADCRAWSADWGSAKDARRYRSRRRWAASWTAPSAGFAPAGPSTPWRGTARRTPPCGGATSSCFFFSLSCRRCRSRRVSSNAS